MGMTRRGLLGGGLSGGGGQRRRTAPSVAETAGRASLTSGQTRDETEWDRSYDLSDNAMQSAFVYSPAKFSMYVGGLGAGKTFAGGLRASIAAMSMPGSLGVIGAPTNGMLNDSTIREFFSILPSALIAHYNNSNQDRHLWLTNGSEILFRSMDNPDRLRGMQLAWFWLDEGPYCGYYAWTVAKTRLRQPGFGGWGWVTGTPKGKDGFWHDFEGMRQKGHALYRASTFANRRHLPPGYVEGMNLTGELYRQEILGLFTAYEGLVYSFNADPYDRQQTHLRTPPPLHSFREVIGGIDWGYRNPSAALPIGIDGDDRAWLLDEFYEGHHTDPEIIAEVVKLTRRYQVEHWYAGPDKPGAIELLRTTLQKEGLRTQVSAADNDVVEGIQTVQSFLSARGDGAYGLYVHPRRCKQTVAEFGQYAYPQTFKKLRNDDEKPYKMYDHALDALRYALHSVYGGLARRPRKLIDQITARLDARVAGLIPDITTFKPGPVGPDDDWY